MTNIALSFSDVIILPQFSRVQSRKEVDLSQNLLGLSVKSPILNSNMDTIASVGMSTVLTERGTLSTLHRFQSVEENVKQFKMINSPYVICSLGTNEDEMYRAKALYDAGCRRFLIDVAHASSVKTCKFYDWMRLNLQDIYIIVGNFATGESIVQFNKNCESKQLPDMVKVGIGGGQICQTTHVTGHGLPLLQSIQDCMKAGIPIIADGGIRSSGDMAKALAFGAQLCMVGSVFAGTDETPGEILNVKGTPVQIEGKYVRHKKFDTSFVTLRENLELFKVYRGSASKASYNAQNKLQEYISPEGVETLVSLKGPVSGIIGELEGGLRSALSYSNSFNLTEFKSNAKIVRVTQSGYTEGLPLHGRKE